MHCARPRAARRCCTSASRPSSWTRFAAAATRIELALRREADRVRLTITDNGRGIAADHVSGMGLGNMRERAQTLPGGRFELDAPGGTGTRVAVSFVVVADRAG
jgi:signal transduction histidine kinase